MFNRTKQEYYNQLYKTNQQKHFDFRHSYHPQQERFLFVANIVIMLYGFIYMIFVQREYGKLVYGILGTAAALFFIASLIEPHISRYKIEKNHENFYECFSVVCALFYIAWGLLVVWASINSGRATNYLPVLIVFTICTLFMYYSYHHYIALFLLTLIGSRIVMAFCPEHEFDIPIYVNIILCGIISTIGGISKYKVAMNRYLSAVQARRLREALQVNNDELKATAEKLRKTNEAQRLFTASMNHELRSPLNGVIGLLQILEEDKSLSSESHENIQKALSSSKTLISIVNDLLDYYKLEAGEFNIVDGEYDLRETVKSVSGVFQSQAKEKELYFNINARPDMPCMLKGDGVRIQQILLNLVSNGVKYTKQGGVDINLDYVDGNLLIAVKDTGIGIKTEDIEVLFDPFKRLEEHRNNAIQGTGLGLYIVKKLIEQMGGNLKLESEYGKGSTFKVRIPTKVTNELIRFKDVTKESGNDERTRDFSGKRLLCVDDNRVNLAVLKGLFKGTNCEITLLDSGTKALEAITTEKFDAIFLDHMMPGMDGVETFTKMQEMEHLNKDVPVVMLTANAGGEAESLYKELGFSGYLPKPLLRESLYEITERVLA